MTALNDANLIFRAFIVLAVIAFGIYMAADRGLVTLALTSDKSYISYVIVVLYGLASLHWLWLVHSLTQERRRFARLDAALGGEEIDSAEFESGLIGEFLKHLRTRGEGGDATALLTAFGDDLANRRALGHFASDVLLKLGLLGTIVGFILMLLPVGEIGAFDPSLMQQLLGSMSSGMAVALYTTLAGLITSTLLKLQYHLLDASAAELETRLAVVTDVYLIRNAT